MHGHVQTGAAAPHSHGVEHQLRPNHRRVHFLGIGTAFEQRVAGAAIEILGLYGQLSPQSKFVPVDGMAYHSYLSSKGYSLQAGTTEVLKNILAGRKLGLPSQ